MEIKKGDRFRCNVDYITGFTEGEIYLCFQDGFITDDEGLAFELKGYTFSGFFDKMPKNSDIIPYSPTSPSHYKAYDIEAIEMMIRIWGKQRVAEWCEITAFKYRCRVGMKDDVQQDLKKEAYYLDKWKELRDDVTG